MKRNFKAFLKWPSAGLLAVLSLFLIVSGLPAGDAIGACIGDVASLPAIAMAQDETSTAGSGGAEQALANRLVAVGILMGVVVAIVAVIYGYLKLELITRGFYSGRLQFAATVVSLLIAAGAYFLWLAITAGISG